MAGTTLRPMAYDEALADRVRGILAGEGDLIERRMFGGLAFLIGGNMAVGVSGQGGLMVRVGADASARLAATTAAEPMLMRGREMTGWLRVAADALDDDAELAVWVERGADVARALPPKRKDPPAL